jgi:uncharacterized protein (TIGR02996 family)
MTDEAFLAAIEATSEDRTPRFVYADWLEEHGDLRASLIRTEEEIRTVPVHADRYWELKRRRHELREQCDREWVQRMRYGTDYEPVFRDVPDDWRGRWRLLREFVERWYGIPAGDVGGRRRESRQLERRLRVTVSPAVREWVVFRADIGASWQRVFRDLYHVRHLETEPRFPCCFSGNGTVPGQFSGETSTPTIRLSSATVWGHTTARGDALNILASSPIG